MEKVDLRSDTFTLPTREMKHYMFDAPVGDDVFGEDPSVNRLEEKVANMFGKEAALFCPSGTMTNQIAVRINTQPQDQVICDQRSHLFNYESGGMASNSGVSARLINGDRGRISSSQVRSSLNPDDPHFPLSKLVVIENTVNKGGGSYYQLAGIASIHKVAREHRLRMHLDGARLFNALVETGETTVDWGHYFDTISICLSKGLGAPVGSVLAGDALDIKQARRVRKVFGGGMRQAGFLAAAGIFALDHHIDRLKTDNLHASRLGEILSARPFVSNVHAVDTNIVIFEMDQIPVQTILDQLAENNILALPFGGQEVRMVTHLGVTENMVDYFETVIKGLKL